MRSTSASVEEPNPAGGSNLVSTYVYDFAGRLTSVSQLRNSTAQTRTFSYFQDGKPYQTTNPESGTTTNAYNTNGTLASVTDAKGQKKTFDYDSYKRVTAVHRWINSSTEDTNQKVEYYYDSNSYESDMNSNLVGRLAAVRYWSLRAENMPYSANEYAEIIESYGYSSAGTVTKKRMRVKARKTTGHSYVDATLETQYTYDNEGRRTQMKYPAVSGWSRQFDYTYNNMGRPSTMTEALNGGGTTTWVSTIGYNVAGQVTSGPHGSYTYNILGQLTRQTHSSTTFDEEYRYSSTADNGKMLSKKNYVSGEDVTYTYDALQRLASATTTQTPTTDAPTWGNSYSYDVYGNLTDMNVTAGSAPSLHVTYDAATNRQNGGATAYDSNGNDIGQTSNPLRTYDIDNRLAGLHPTSFGQPMGAYGYDPSNKRILKSDALLYDGTTPTKLYLHTIDGSRIGEYQLNFNSGGTALTLDLVSANVWFGGKLLREGDWNVVQDAKGSVRWRQLAVSPYTIEKADYYPFGQEKPSATTQGREKFGTYLRDETGLDYADQRYFSSTVGRFMTADPYRASGGPANPGSWNRYSYVEGDPLNWFDSRGLLKECTNGDGCNPPPPPPQAPPSSPGPTIDPPGDCVTFPDAEVCRPAIPLTGWEESDLLTQDAKQRLRKAANLLIDSNCQLAFEDYGVDLAGAVWDIADSLRFFGTWGPMGMIQLSEVSGVAYNQPISLYEWCPVSDLGCFVPNTTSVVLTASWLGASTTLQAGTLLHEVIHAIMGDDIAIADKFGLAYAIDPNNPGKTLANASNAWDNWFFEKGCSFP